MSPRLRLYSEDGTSLATAPSMVSVRLAEIIEPLMDAMRTNRAFMRDFAEDEVQLPADLFEILIAYRRVRVSA